MINLADLAKVAEATTKIEKLWREKNGTTPMPDAVIARFGSHPDIMAIILVTNEPPRKPTQH
jgi:hypothetical protein